MRYRHERGFTLIETLIALFIVMVGVLALSRFTVAIMGSGRVAGERMTAVHLAGQVLEYWREDVNAPLIAAADCALTAGVPLPVYPVTTICKAAMGSEIKYTIYMNETQVSGPLPASHTALTPFTRGTMPTPPSTLPKTMLVRVSWAQHGTLHQIYLTNISKP